MFNKTRIFFIATCILLMATNGFATTKSFTTVFNFTDGDSGYIQLDGLSYGIGTGASNCVIYFDNTPTATNKRAVFRFATYTIPDNATVTVVEFFNRLNIAQGTPACLSATSHLGAWIGAALNAGASDYNATGATDLKLDPIGFADGSWNDLSGGGIDPTSLIVLDSAINSGNTDLMFKDTDTTEDNTRSWNAAKSKCQLRVTYTVPYHLLPTLGVGAFRYIRGIDLKKRLVIFRQTFNPIEEHK